MKSSTFFATGLEIIYKRHVTKKVAIEVIFWELTIKFIAFVLDEKNALLKASFFTLSPQGFASTWPERGAN